MKRSDYITWDQYFMGIAIMSAHRSKDPGTQVGACIVDEDNRILSVGYNGMPAGCNDDVMPWAREGSNLESKYFFVCHLINLSPFLFILFILYKYYNLICIKSQ